MHTYGIYNHGTTFIYKNFKTRWISKNFDSIKNYVLQIMYLLIFHCTCTYVTFDLMSLICKFIKKVLFLSISINRFPLFLLRKYWKIMVSIIFQITEYTIRVYIWSVKQNNIYFTVLWYEVFHKYYTMQNMTSRQKHTNNGRLHRLTRTAC